MELLSIHIFLTLLLSLQISLGFCVATTNNTASDDDLDSYQAEGSDFFPHEYKKTKLKFPEEEEPQHKFQTSASELVDDIDEKTAIDIILHATKSGRDLGDDVSEFSELTSDPKIKAEIAAGNDVQARNYIRDKLCDLGLMPCGESSGISKKHDFGGGGYDGIGGIPYNDVKLVQPVALKPIGPPISAVPLEPFKQSYAGPLPPIKPYGEPGGFAPSSLHNGYGKQLPLYGPLLASSPPLPPYNKPFGIGSNLGSLPGPKPFPGPAPGLPYAAGGKIVEHIHHHIHHTPGSGGTYGVIGATGGLAGGQASYGGGFDEYGAAQKPAISLATPSGTHLGTFPQKKNNDFSGDYNRLADDCTCVLINQCASYDIVQQGQGTSGREVVQGTGVPNSGLVGYNIDPRNRVNRFGVESNATDENVREPRILRRRKREDKVQAAAESPKVEGEGRFLTSLLRDATFQNLTKFAGYDFGDDPTQLVKMDGNRLRIFGRLLGFEPTVGVSFGLPGGYPQAGGGYPLNPLSTDPLVNPYNGGGISLGPISVNPLVSFQKTKDKDKTKIFKPLVNLHITPNPGLLYGIKGLFHQKKAAKAHKFGLGGYAYPYPYPAPVPVPVPVAVPVAQPLPQVHHLHDHQHYHHKYQQYYPQSSGYGWPSYYNYPTYTSASAYNYGKYPATTGYGYSQAYANSYSSDGAYYGNYRASPTRLDSGSSNRDYIGPTVSSSHRDEFSSFSSAGPAATSSLFTTSDGGGGRQYSNSFGSGGGGKYSSDFNSGSTDNSRQPSASSETEDSALIQELIADGEITQEEVDEINRGEQKELDVRRGRTLFPASRQERFRSELVSEQGLDRRILPTGNIETRLPIHATRPDATHTDSKFFPTEQDRQGENRAPRSRVTFPDEKKEGRSRRSTSTSQFARVLSQSLLKSQRQLNLGGTCPNGYVCCRNPIRPTNQNTYPAAVTGNNNNVYSNNNLQSQAFLQNQNLGVCGKRNARGITGRVTNPNPIRDGDTDYGEYPWQVAILKKDGYDNVYVCGGSIIDERHVVTAAHCLKGLNPNDLRVRLGEWDVNHETEFYPHLERDVAGFAMHPDFYAGNLFNDIAVMRLEGAVDFRQNPHISPICIPPTNAEFGGQRCFVTGWGKDSFGEKGKYQNVLKEVDLPVLRHFDCEQKLKRTRLGPDFVLHSGFICAGGEEGKDACKGDGGGPLVCNVQGTFMLTGIVSWGVGCGHREVPGVYVKVSKYRDWLQETIKV